MMRSISIVVACWAIVGCGAQSGRDTTTATARAYVDSSAVAPRERVTSESTPAPTVSMPAGGSRTDTMPPGPADAITNQGHATLVDVRVARQPGFERIVFEFDSGVPQHAVQYEQNLMQCGSGDPVTVAGGATLVARFRSTVAHRFEGERPVVTVPARDMSPGLPQVRQLKQICDFEGEVEWAIGVAEQRPFTLSTQSAPPRIVIDVH